MDPTVRDEVVAGSHYQPHEVLGPHVIDGEVWVRAVKPYAQSVSVETLDGTFTAVEESPGLWAARVPGKDAPDYRLHVTWAGTEHVMDDPYRFMPFPGELDLHLIREGRHEKLWEALGARAHTLDSVLGEVRGTSFAVWAPNARAVRVVGDFNGWSGAGHAMRSLGVSGVWELFVPGALPGQRYKFEILGKDGHWRLKADPMARRTECPPDTASIIDESAYEWNDASWMSARASRQVHKEAMSVYEVHIGSWRQGLDYREFAHQLRDYVLETGFTHVEFMPVMEHPFGPSWGYQVTSYYAPSARFGSPDDFRYVVDTLHQAGIGVLLDWVPGHFPKDAWALGQFDGSPLYEHPDPLRGEQPDWGTYIFDFGRPEVRNFLVANALFWIEEFHADGLRVDAVASMLYLDYSREDGQWRPNIHGGRENLDAISFLQEVNATAYRRNPGIVMVAEESTAWPGVTAPTDAGGLGFGLKWNMGWMNDTLRYLGEDPMHRGSHHHNLTFSLMYAFSEQYILPLSHDEVVHGKGSLWERMPGDDWRKAAGVRALLALQWTHPGKQLLFMGCEFAQRAEWSEARSLDWGHLDNDGHRGVLNLVRDLNALYRETPALYERDTVREGFTWINGDDAGRSVIAFLRHDDHGNEVAVAINMSGLTYSGYRLDLPRGGTWDEVLNSDAETYGGAGAGNVGSVEAVEEPGSRWGQVGYLTLPALGAIVLRPR